MIAHNDKFYHGVAMVLQGESQKAGCYVTHGQSLGVLREKMVARFIRDMTPDRLRVETGLIVSLEHELHSRQCDLLVHDATDHAPVYRWEDFVIVNAEAAKIVIEVKSNLDQETFGDVLKIHDSIANLEIQRGRIPVFGYALDGVQFDTFCQYVVDTVEDASVSHLPECIVVQSENYIGVKACQPPTGHGVWFCALDLTKLDEESTELVDGVETGMFLQFYALVLKNRIGALDPASLCKWFNSLPIKDCGKAWIDSKGTISRGNAPLEEKE